MRNGSARAAGLSLLLCLTLSAAAAAGCAPARPAARTATTRPLPEKAYHLDPTLPRWIDPETGYDTTRRWKLDGGEWPIALVMSPSQAPQLLAGMRDGVYAAKLAPFGITPVTDKIEMPARTFHALQHSKWPFVYMPLAVLTDYSRSPVNQTDAGGLQYVALAGSTAGGGYTLVTKDPAIRTVADLAGKKVAQDNSNPVPATLMSAAAAQAGLTLGDGEGQIRFIRGVNGQQVNDYNAGRIDALITLNILLPRLLVQGSHVVTDFSETPYTPNYTILAVERSVLEERPDVVRAVLEAHYEANKTAVAEWESGLKATLMRSWNAYFETQTAPSAAQRIVKDQAGFDVMLGRMQPEQRLDARLLADCWATLDRDGLWGWEGTVDASRLSDLKLYDSVLQANGEPPQSAASK